MRLRRPCSAVAAVAVVGVVGVSACSVDLDTACGDYVDAADSLDTTCGDVGVLPQTRTNFVAVCDALVTAPGVQDLAAQVEQCAGQLRSLDCNGTASCKITGTLPDGAACGAGQQCAGGICNTTASTDPTSEVACGKCSSYVAIGGNCSTGVCDPTAGGCVQGTCVAYAQRDESCTDAPCANALQCDSTSLTCQPYPTEGQSCSTECAYPEKCSSGTCVDPAQQGGACPTGVECATGLVCDSGTRTCSKPGIAEAGQPCGFVNGQIVDCDGGLKCAAPSQGHPSCVAPKQIGDACTVGDGECDVFLACVGGTCQVPDYSVCKG